ncbi:MAG: response regulator [Gammaproteobacteria bacterium]|nr:response regulator [Gammaproteobacteria bacterium]
MMNKQLEKSSMDVLLVEDDMAHQMLTKKAFMSVGLPCRMSIANNGEEAMAFLYKEAPFFDVKRPDLILLDLNMPKMDGHEVLKAVKNNPDLAQIPVVVLSTSNNPIDVQACYAEHANSFLQKHVDMECFIRAVDVLKQYWFEQVLLPEELGH